MHYVPIGMTIVSGLFYLFAVWRLAPTYMATPKGDPVEHPIYLIVYLSLATLSMIAWTVSGEWIIALAFVLIYIGIPWSVGHGLRYLRNRKRVS